MLNIVFKDAAARINDLAIKRWITGCIEDIASIIPIACWMQVLLLFDDSHLVHVVFQVYAFQVLVLFSLEILRDYAAEFRKPCCFIVEFFLLISSGIVFLDCTDGGFWRGCVTLLVVILLHFIGIVRVVIPTAIENNRIVCFENTNQWVLLLHVSVILRCKKRICNLAIAPWHVLCWLTSSGTKCVIFKLSWLL